MVMKHEIDDYDLSEFKSIAAKFGQNRFGYVVTPNVDHLIRCWENPDFREMYAGAAYVLLDSRFLAKLLRFVRGPRLPVCAGSDLTRELFDSVIQPTDRIVMIGGAESQARTLRERFGLTGLAHLNPPMGLIHSPPDVEACLQFIEQNSPFRFCFLAIGSPQQEIIARHLLKRGVARGLTLCVGASLNFLTGQERRAPTWMQRAGFEWAYRLLGDPRRFAHRYLVRGPRIFWLLPRFRFVVRERRNVRPGSLSPLGATVSAGD